MPGVSEPAGAVQVVAYCLREVAFNYDAVTALEGISLEVMRGERVALLGANGSGKSTLLRLLAGLSFPAQGDVYFEGERLTQTYLENEQSFYCFRRKVGIVFQNSDVQLFNPTVFDEVAFGPLQLGWPREDIRRRVRETMEQLGIAHLSGRSPHRLSGGEKKRVALASVLVTNPSVLLLDEPTAGLDPASQTQMIDLLASWAGTPRTVVIATHDLAALEAASDRCVLLSRGALAADGETLSILHDILLLERTELIRPYRHQHGNAQASHGHVHRDELL